MVFGSRYCEKAAFVAFSSEFAIFCSLPQQELGLTTIIINFAPQ
jgi:hypothetical protein